MAKPQKPEKPKGRRVAEIALIVLAVGFFATRLLPEMLLWPYASKIGDTRIYSEKPIAPQISSVLARSNALLRKSEIFSDGYGKRIFLTDGGWRWKFLSLTLSGAFAHSSGWTEAIVINKNSIADDWVLNGQAIGGQRKLSGLIAHERTHGLIRARYGRFKSRLIPSWKLEGYCDYVAAESSLTARDVAELNRTGDEHPAIVYFEGRKLVRQILESEGKTVDQLFAE